MGRSFTSTQILNLAELSNEKFIEKFCNSMKKDGYVTFEQDEEELSYVFAFANNCRWVTLCSESYEDGNVKASSDTARISKMLGTECVNTVVIDSDCAMLNLYDSKGQKADTLVMGYTDDYIGEEISSPKREIWDPLLIEENTWEQVVSLQQKEYTFVEDGLRLFAPFVGMDCELIMSEISLLDPNASKEIYFNRVKNKSKSTKKVTLDNVLNQLLTPYGFVKLKTKHPYYGRIIDGEVVQIISYRNSRSEVTGMKQIEMLVGISSIYRNNFDYIGYKDPTINGWFYSFGNILYYIYLSDIDNELLKQYMYFLYDPEKITETFETAVCVTKKYIMPYLDSFKNIESVTDYYTMYLPKHLYLYYDKNKSKEINNFFDSCNDGLLLIKKIDKDRFKKCSIAIIDFLKKNNTHEKSIEYYHQMHDEILEKLDYIKSNEILFNKANEELLKRKEINTDKFKQLGIKSEE